MKPDQFRILVVDDEEVMRRTLAELLRLEGYTVATAENGDEAIKIISSIADKSHSANEYFDLILLDLKMPGRDGIDVLRYAHQEVPDVQIILLTAHGSLQSAIEALRLGAHDYLLKPASAKQIIQSTQQALRRRNEQRNRDNLIKQLADSIHALQSTKQITVENPDKSAVILPIPSTPSSTKKLSLSRDFMRYDPARRELSYGEWQISLTPAEGKLLHLFLENPEVVFTHRELVEKVQGYAVSDREAVEVLRPLIRRLRKKLSQIPGAEKLIVSVRSTGYYFSPQD
jgi:DNA-binding response OmpR family regulator